MLLKRTGEKERYSRVHIQ